MAESQAKKDPLEVIAKAIGERARWAALLVSILFMVILAPESGASLAAFALAGVAARLPRFLIVSVGTALIGQGLRRWLSERQLLWVLIGAWLLFYAVFFARMPN